MSFKGLERQMCEAYREKKSCFMAFRSKDDRGWCEHLRDGKSCFMALNGNARKACEAGRAPANHRRWLAQETGAPLVDAPVDDGRSCFMAFDGRERQMCEAYREQKSCFMAFKGKDDRGWCEHLRDGKSCFMALNGNARKACEAGRIPFAHQRWSQSSSSPSRSPSNSASMSASASASTSRSSSMSSSFSTSSPPDEAPDADPVDNSEGQRGDAPPAIGDAPEQDDPYDTFDDGPRTAPADDADRYDDGNRDRRDTDDDHAPVGPDRTPAQDVQGMDDAPAAALVALAGFGFTAVTALPATLIGIATLGVGCLVYPAVIGFFMTWMGDLISKKRSAAIMPILAVYGLSAVAGFFVGGSYVVVSGAAGLIGNAIPQATGIIGLASIPCGLGLSLAANAILFGGAAGAYFMTADDKRPGDDGSGLPGLLEPEHPVPAPGYSASARRRQRHMALAAEPTMAY